MTDIRRLVLDVLKPHHPSIVELARRLSVLEGVSGVNCTLEEVDQETESIKITIEGNAIDFDSAGAGDHPSPGRSSTPSTASPPARSWWRKSRRLRTADSGPGAPRP